MEKANKFWIFLNSLSKLFLCDIVNKLQMLLSLVGNITNTQLLDTQFFNYNHKLK
jgi:hypothetical protein